MIAKQPHLDLVALKRQEIAEATGKIAIIVNDENMTARTWRT